MLDSSDMRLFAGLDNNHDVCDLGDVHNTVRVFSVHLQEDQALLAAAHVRGCARVRAQISFELLFESQYLWFVFPDAVDVPVLVVQDNYVLAFFGGWGYVSHFRVLENDVCQIQSGALLMNIFL